jgi:threonine dehydrogenase-like Zn-dependent dehydrogenase
LLLPLATGVMLLSQVLGHEFVGLVERCDAAPALVGHRVVGEINCRTEPCTHPDPIFVRNHAPRRTVLGIIAKDGVLAEYCTLPAENLLLVPEGLSDQEACFAEPLAAACRIVEQQVRRRGWYVPKRGLGL